MPDVIVAGRRAMAAAVLAAAAGCAAGYTGTVHARKPAVTAHSRRTTAAPHAPELPGLYLGLGAGP